MRLNSFEDNLELKTLRFKYFHFFNNQIEFNKIKKF